MIHYLATDSSFTINVVLPNWAIVSGTVLSLLYAAIKMADLYYNQVRWQQKAKMDKLIAKALGGNKSDVH